MAWSPLSESPTPGTSGHIAWSSQVASYLNDENAARGIQWVDPSYGNNSNSGAYGHPVQTIAQAVTNLGSAGGTVHLGAGTLSADNIEVNAPISFIGSGRAATVVNTAGTSARGFWVRGESVSLRGSRSMFTNFTMQGSTSATATTRLIDVDTADWVLIDNVDFWNVGFNRADFPALSASPVAVYVSASEPYGSGTISDWFTLRSCQFYRCYVGSYTSGTGDGYVYGNSYIAYRRMGAYVAGSAWKLANIWFASGSPSTIVGTYALEFGSGYHNSGVNLHFETGNAPDCHHIRITDGYRTHLVNTTHKCHNTTSTYCVDLQGGGLGCVIGQYVVTGTGVFRDQSTGTHYLWVPADYTGTWTS